MKHILSTLLTVLSLALLFFLPACNQTSAPATCLRPNPLIIFDALNTEGFSVTPDTLAQVTTVIIQVSGKSGAPTITFTGQPGVATLINLDTAYQRPLLLKFTYKSATDTLAEDNLKVDDSQSHGVTIPDMDVIVGISPFSNCPGTSQNVNVTTNNGVSIFNWQAGQTFEVLLVYNGTSYKFRVHPVPGASGSTSAGTATIYERPSQVCLSDIDMQTVSTKEQAITNIPNCTVRAWNDDTIRTVTIRHPTTATISVSR